MSSIWTPKPIWPAMPSGAECNMRVIIGTGDFSSGKSMFGLTIAPGVHPEGHPFAGKPRTRCYDMEQSCGTYRGIGAEIKDVYTEVMKDSVNPNDRSASPKDPTPLDIYLYLKREFEMIQPNQFDVVMVDPFTDIDAGLEAYITRTPSKFGLTAEQIAKAKGLYWGAVKNSLKSMINSLAAKVQTVYFTTHLRNEYAGNAPTGKREPKGKETIFEMASLYLWFDRKPFVQDGKKIQPEAPRAHVLKQRLSDTSVDAEGGVRIITLLPPALKVATVKQIREYIKTPPDYDNLKPEEKVNVQEMTPDERLQMETLKASLEAESSANTLQALEKQARNLAMQNKLQSAVITADQSGEYAAKAEKRTESLVESAAQESNESAAGTTSTVSTAVESTVVTSTGDTEEKLPYPDKYPNTPEDQYPPEDARVTADDLERLKKVMDQVDFGEGKIKTNKVRNGFFKAGVPVVNGVPKASLMSKDICNKLIAKIEKLISSKAA